MAVATSAQSAHQPAPRVPTSAGFRGSRLGREKPRNLSSPESSVLAASAGSPPTVPFLLSPFRLSTSVHSYFLPYDQEIKLTISYSDLKPVAPLKHSRSFFFDS